MSTLHAFYPSIEEYYYPHAIKDVTLTKTPRNSTPFILSLPIQDSMTLVKIYEGCMKPLYTMNIVLLDKLHNRSNYSLLLVNLSKKFISCFDELNDIKKFINISRVEGATSLMSTNCFVRSILSDFDSHFGSLLQEIDSVNSRIFEHASYWGIQSIASIYSQIITKEPEGEISVPKDLPTLENFHSSVLIESESFRIYKKLNGHFDPRAIVVEDLMNFREGISKTLHKEAFSNNPTLTKSQSIFTEDNLKIVNSQSFKKFNANRLQLLGLLDKKIF